ncbi:hypothetical protein SLS62_001074 [Diatrype stigma]|uniref:Uncharacterized protein n=1 Tax=Diatrype stigma TaxID=117547 RepID=A0AAN9YU38_9PEZI
MAEDHPTDPISAVTSAFVGDLASIGLSVADFPRDIFKAARGKPKPHEVTEDVPDNATVATNGETSSTVALTEVASGATVIAAAEDLPMAELDAGTERRAEAEAESNRQPRKLRLKPGNDAMGGLTLSFSSDTLPNPDDVVPAQRHRAASSPETPHRAGSPHHNGPTSPPQEHDKLERVMGAGKSVNNIVATGMRTPMNFCMGLAKGFRNLPRLYNDDTVRPPEKVTGIGSGLKIAGKEFGFGMYDGISGLVTQPYRGAQKQGALGLVKGFGKGIGGLAFKPWAGKFFIM